MNLLFWLMYDTKYYFYLMILGIVTLISVLLTSFLFNVALGPDHGFPAYFIGVVLGFIITSAIYYWYETKHDREERERNQREKEENRSLIDTSRCASCSTPVANDESHCPSCGFDMSKIRELKSSQ